MLPGCEPRSRGMAIAESGWSQLLTRGSAAGFVPSQARPRSEQPMPHARALPLILYANQKAARERERVETSGFVRRECFEQRAVRCAQVHPSVRRALFRSRSGPRRDRACGRPDGALRPEFAEWQARQSSPGRMSGPTVSARVASSERSTSTHWKSGCVALSTNSRPGRERSRVVEKSCKHRGRRP